MHEKGGCPADCPMHAEGGCPADCPMHAEGACPMGAACPMMKAREAGATATVEETDRGALIRIEAPAGDSVARDEARKAAQRIAVMLERGCPAAKGKAAEKKQQK